MTEESIVRDNLMTRRGYAPYCGNQKAARELGGCNNPRTRFTGSQFRCHTCGWVSEFPADFIQRYKFQWGIEEPTLPLTIRVTKATSKDAWYRNRIGDDFPVLKVGKTTDGHRMYITHLGRIVNSYVLASDSVIIPEKAGDYK